MVLDAGFKFIGGIFEASSVNQQKTVVNAGGDIVARGAFFAGHDGEILARQTVEQAGFASVSLTNQGDNRERFHRYIITLGVVFVKKNPCEQGWWKSVCLDVNNGYR